MLNLAFIAIGMLPWVYLIAQCLKQLLLSSESRPGTGAWIDPGKTDSREPHYS